jgi:hypothetical protein
MGSRWETSVFQEIVKNVDPDARAGKDIGLAGLDNRILDGCPDVHPDTAPRVLREIYDCLAEVARADGRLAATAPLIKNWKLSSDIYSPKLRRFIEVDEYQHFSQPRLERIAKNRFSEWGPLYSTYFWENVFETLKAKAFRDRDPPHRDEARAYRDEMRERLPVVYGLGRTIRLDEFTLAKFGLSAVADLISLILKEEAG